MFTHDELGVVQALSTGKKLTDEQKDLVDGLKAKLNASSQAAVPDRFREVTGWANPPKDYPA